MFSIASNIGNSRSFFSGASLREIEAVLRMAERLPLVSQDIIDSLNSGEAPEVIIRQLIGLHNINLEVARSVREVLPVAQDQVA